MLRNLKIVVTLLCCICCYNSYSQEVNAKKDSTEVYAKIRDYSKKNKFTKTIHKLFFKRIDPKKKEEIVHQIDTINAEGKIIRKINIVTLDPFGHSVTDTTASPQKWAEKVGNRLHFKTKKIAIYNLLLIKKNTPYNAYQVQESERIIRSQSYVTGVKILTETISKESDSVDLTVRVLDSWSTIPRFSISSTKVSAGIKEKDFLGLGQQLDYRFSNRFSDGANGNNLAYTIPNIKNTFISTVLKYNMDLDNNYSKSINVGRSFYSPLTKWAGGVYVGQDFKRDSLQAQDLTYAFQNFKHNSEDFWIGRASRLFGDKNTGITNLIVSGRFFNVNYKQRPTVIYDSIGFFSDEKLILTGIGANTRKFVKDSYIFRNGNTEDVAIGRIYGITLGYQYKNSIWRPYLGAQFSFGNYYDWGFLSTNFEAGTFFNQSKTYQTAFTFESNYFTKLFTLGRWKFRQFIKPKLIIGINREASIGDRLSLNQDNGINGFNSPVFGTSKMLLSVQTQTYSPYAVLGFRMNPFFNYSIAVLGSPNDAMMKNKAYSKLTLGLLISNDYLVFSSFQLSLSYYPTIPNQGEGIFKPNTIETTDFGLQKFELEKPRLVEYK